MDDKKETSQNSVASSDLPLVFVIVLNWNGKEDLLRCLGSLSGVKYGNFKTLVVDNASEDGSVQAVRENFPEVKVIQNSRNLMFSEGNNVGMEYALSQNSDYVLLLNNDIVVAPQFLTEMVLVAQSDPLIGMVGPKIYYYDNPERLWFAGGKVELWRGRIRHLGIREFDSGQYDSTRDIDYVTGCAILVNRGVIEKVGMLDASYYIYSEDVDWCWRAKNARYRSVLAPKAKIWHRISASTGGGLTPFKVYWRIKCSLRFYRRYARWYHWLTMPVFVSFATAKFVSGQIFKGNLEVVSSLLRGFKDSLLRSRAPAGTIRKASPK